MHELVLRLGRKLQEGEEVSVEGSTSDIVSKSLLTRHPRAQTQDQGGAW